MTKPTITKRNKPGPKPKPVGTRVRDWPTLSIRIDPVLYRELKRRQISINAAINAALRTALGMM